MKITSKYKQFIRFVIVGSVSTILNFLVYYFFLKINLNLELSAILGYITGLLFSFIFGKSWVFKSKDSNINKQIILFVSIYLISLTIYTVLISFLSDYYGNIL